MLQAPSRSKQQLLLQSQYSPSLAALSPRVLVTSCFKPRANNFLHYCLILLATPKQCDPRVRRNAGTGQKRLLGCYRNADFAVFGPSFLPSPLASEDGTQACGISKWRALFCDRRAKPATPERLKPATPETFLGCFTTRPRFSNRNNESKLVHLAWTEELPRLDVSSRSLSAAPSSSSSSFSLSSNRGASKPIKSEPVDFCLRFILSMMPWFSGIASSSSPTLFTWVRMYFGWARRAEARGNQGCWTLHPEAAISAEGATTVLRRAVRGPLFTIAL